MKKTWRIITMKNSIRKNMKKRLAGMMTVASVMLIGVSPITAFAQVPECTCETKCTEDCVDPDCEICKEDISLCEGTEADPVEEPDTEETYGPLTPDGNLSLVDDYGTIEAGGKQFITVVTKSGNYFYIIIDRDDEGDETVHFLNMVDESDLLSLMDDEGRKTVATAKLGDNCITLSCDEYDAVPLFLLYCYCNTQQEH